ncbi:MAG: amidohydrolase [Acidimicrobiales bacterium]|nr:amidohydrolase [Hyphomonadaceae bacterium]RZV39977.1 MAG: amidohydrolase [Acidimicrobiales bacterium]
MHFVVATAIALALGACSPKETSTATSGDLVAPPDMCLHNASIYGSDASAITVTNGKIIGLEPESNTCAAFVDTETEIFDLNGSYVYPGFVDGHGHLLGIGLREMTLNLEGTASIKELQDRLREVVSATAEGETIFGRGWIETHWPENRFPNRGDLDLVAPENPVILERADGHAVVANSMALEKSNVTKDTEAPFGGDILLGKDGNPSGMLIDKADRLVMGLVGELTPERKRAAYIKGGEVYAGYGWTGIQSMSVNPADVPLIEELSDSGKIGIRVYNAIDLNGAESLLDQIGADGPRTNSNGRVVTRAIKVYADGALGSRGASLLEPYTDDPDNSGLLLSKKQEMMPVFERALRDGMQISMHAIGDNANRMVLDWFEEAMNNVPVEDRKVADPRWRIEHSQILDVADIPRFKELGIIASMQPSHAIGDLHFAVDRLGVDRLRGGYAWRSLIDSGAIIAGGTDAPVERGDPRIEFYAAVARKDAKGFSTEGWYPDEKVTRAEAIKMFSEWNAYAAFEEDVAGTIAVGNNADFTIFNKDIMSIPEAEILSVTPVMTIVDGEVVFKN